MLPSEPQEDRHPSTVIRPTLDDPAVTVIRQRSSVKRQYRKTAFYVSHPLVQTRLRITDRDRLIRQLKKRQLRLSEWILDALARDEAERPTESEARARMIFDESACRQAEEVLIREADLLMQLGERHKADPLRAREYRQRAGVLMNSAAFFTESLRKYRQIRARGSSD